MNIAIAILFVFFYSPTWAANYYVALNGTDASGTTCTSSSAPCKTIEGALEGTSIAGGDTLNLMCNTNGSGSPCVYDAANFWKSGSDKVITKTVTGALTIQPQSGKSVTLNIPSDSANYTFTIEGEWSFKGLNWTNTNSVAQYFLQANAGGSAVTFNDGLMDFNGASASFFKFAPSSGIITVTIERMKITNSNAESTILSLSSSGTGKVAFYSKASLVYRIGVYFALNSIDSLCDIYLYNNTFVNIRKNYLVTGIYNQGIRDIRNNIFRGDGTYTTVFWSLEVIDPAKWTLANNIFYTTNQGYMGSLLQVGLTDHFDMTDYRNFYIDPVFTNEGADNYTPTSAYISGRGDSTVLPSTDVNGHAWTGADMGAVYNPAATALFPALNSLYISFLGDSLAHGIADHEHYAPSLTPLVPMGWASNEASQEGSGVSNVKWSVDKVAVNYSSKFVVFFSCNNNFQYSGNYPTNMTYLQCANDLMIAVRKARYWGMIPIVLNMAGVKSADVNIQHAKPDELAAVLGPVCQTENSGPVPYYNTIAAMRLNENWANSEATGGYYGGTGLAGDVHPGGGGYALLLSGIKEIISGMKFPVYAPSRISSGVKRSGCLN